MGVFASTSTAASNNTTDIQNNTKITKEVALLIAKLNFHAPFPSYDINISEVSLSKDKKFWKIKIKFDHGDIRNIKVDTTNGASKMDNEKWISFIELKVNYVADLYYRGLIGGCILYGYSKPVTVNGTKLWKIDIYNYPECCHPKWETPPTKS